MVQQVSFDKQHHQKKQPRTDENSSPPLLGRHKQGVIMPAEATVGGSSRSKQQHQQQQPSSDAARDRTVEPLIVFDWDDTILTSSWIQVNELLQAGSYDELPLEVRRDLARLERRCVCRFFCFWQGEDLGVACSALRHQQPGVFCFKVKKAAALTGLLSDRKSPS